MLMLNENQTLKRALNQKLKLALKPALIQVLQPNLKPVLMPKHMSMHVQWIKVMLMLRLRNETMGTLLLNKRGS